MKTNPHEPIFARPHSHDVDPLGVRQGDMREDYRDQTGMTLRQHFAIECLSGILASRRDWDVPASQLPELAVDYADALIKALNQEHEALIAKMSAEDED